MFSKFTITNPEKDIDQISAKEISFPNPVTLDYIFLKRGDSLRPSRGGRARGLICLFPNLHLLEKI